MANRLAGVKVEIVTAVTFLFMIIVNALANILPLNGLKTGQISNFYPNLFAPAAFTFAIWGLIYLLLAGYTIYQLGYFQNPKDTAKPILLLKIDILFSISSLANAVWIFSWHYMVIPLSMLWMIVILLCLIAIMETINKEQLSTRQKLFIKLPFSVYVGWITVAAIANLTILLVSLGWESFGMSPIWMIILISVGMLIGAAVTIWNRDLAYGLVIVWAYLGICIKHISLQGFSGQYPAIITTVIICIGLLIFALAYVLITRNPETP